MDEIEEILLCGDVSSLYMISKDRALLFSHETKDIFHTLAREVSKGESETEALKNKQTNKTPLHL